MPATSVIVTEITGEKEKERETDCEKAAGVSGTPPNFEDILEQLGGFGRFQFLSLLLILILEIPAAFLSFIPIFAGATPQNWSCDGEPVDLDKICSCNGTLSTNESSIVAEWNLVCDKAWVSDFMTSLQMLGMVLGNFYAGKFSDWYGRKVTFLASVLFMALGTSVSASSPNPYVYGFSKVLCGCGMSAFLGLSSVYSMEFQTPRWRHLCGCVGPWGEGIMILAGLAYYIHPWRDLTWATAAPFSLILVIYPLLPESPRFLLRNQRVKEAQKVLNQIAKINGKPPVDLETVKNLADSENPTSNPDSKAPALHQYTYLDFFRRKELRLRTILLMILWASWLTTNFGIGFNIKNLSGNIYLNVVLLGLTDAVGYPSSLAVCDRIGRKKSTALFMSLAASFLVALAILEATRPTGSSFPTTIVVLVILGKLGISAARGTVRTVTGESFPTAIRTMGVGITCIFGNLVSTTAPQLAFLGSRWPGIPFFAFAIISLTGAVISFFLQETQGRALESEVNVDQSEVDVGPPNSNQNLNSIQSLPRLRARTRDENIEKPENVQGSKVNVKVKGQS